MHKIAIVTNYRFTNYGSALQAYALQKIIKELGYECENLRYDLKQLPPKKVTRLISAIRNPSKILEKLFKIGRHLRHYKFEQFFNQYIDENDHLYESIDELSDATRDMHRAIVSLMEELEAVDWYNQRVDACKDEELKAILAHNRDEEKEHAAMVLEWIRRQDPTFDKELRDYVFTDKPIVDLEHHHHD